MAPHWQAIEVKGSLLLGDLGSQEYLAINPWSFREVHEFKRPARTHWWRRWFFFRRRRL